MKPNQLSVLVSGLLYATFANANTGVDVATDEEVPTVQFASMYVSATAPKQGMSYLKNEYGTAKNLGDVVEGLSGVQSTAFGPHAGAPMIRSLSGNRVNIAENNVRVNGLNAISGGTGVAFDPVFFDVVAVHKFNNVVSAGGYAIGGSVDINNGLVATQLAEKPLGLELYSQKGFNDFDSYGLKANVNNQKNLQINLVHSSQNIDGYDIKGQSKAEVCNHIVTKNAQGRLGKNTNLVDSCQREVDISRDFNIASRPYVDTGYYDLGTNAYTQDYYDYGLSPSDVFTQNPNPYRAQVVANPHYVKDAVEYTDSAKVRDITENYHGKLGNSDAKNRRTGIAGTYFWQAGFLALGVDDRQSDYGLPGFSLSNLGRGLDYTKGADVRIKSQQQNYIAQAVVNSQNPWWQKNELHLAQLNENSQEYAGDTLANDYDFRTLSARASTTHQPSEHWSGLVGFDFSKRRVNGRGELIYLPNVDTDVSALFIKESAKFGWATLDVGYRHERVKHHIQASDFKLSRNAQNQTLSDTSYKLNNYELQARFEPFDNLGFKLAYAKSYRAPEINELYASNVHYSMMAQEEGDLTLKPESVDSLEATALFKVADVNVTTSVYQNKFKDYLYLGRRGAEADAARLPLKYWQQHDVKATGFEVDVHKSFDLDKWGVLTASAFLDVVKNKASNANRITLHNDGAYMPNMPSGRYGASLGLDYQSWYFGLNAVRHNAPKYQNVASEAPLPAYTLVGLDIKKDFMWHGNEMSVHIGGDNLLNAEARPHNSPLRYIAPMAGRSFNVGLRMKF